MNPQALESILKAILPMVQLAVPFAGPATHGIVERAVTIPEADVRSLCKGMSEADVQTALGIVRSQIADGISDLAVLIASRGKIQPD